MSKHRLRQSSPEHSLITPYPDPDERRPDAWNERSYHNWCVYMRPIYEQLSNTAQTWYRRVYRPKHSTGGVTERDEIEAYTEEDYIAEQVATLICDGRVFQLPAQRRVARIRADDDIHDIATQIARAVETICAQRPSGQAPTVDIDADVDSSDLPLTPTIAIGFRRTP